MCLSRTSAHPAAPTKAVALVSPGWVLASQGSRHAEVASQEFSVLTVLFSETRMAPSTDAVLEVWSGRKGDEEGRLST